MLLGQQLNSVLPGGLCSSSLRRSKTIKFNVSGSFSRQIHYKQTCILRAAVSACPRLAARLIHYTSICYVTPFMGNINIHIQYNSKYPELHTIM